MAAFFLDFSLGAFSLVILALVFFPLAAPSFNSLAALGSFILDSLVFPFSIALSFGVSVSEELSSAIFGRASPLVFLLSFVLGAGSSSTLVGAASSATFVVLPFFAFFLSFDFTNFTV